MILAGAAVIATCIAPVTMVTDAGNVRISEDRLDGFVEAVESIGSVPGAYCEMRASDFIPDDASVLTIKPGIVVIRHDAIVITRAMAVSLGTDAESIELRAGDAVLVRSIADSETGRPIAYLEKVDASSLTAAQNLVMSLGSLYTLNEALAHPVIPLATK